MKRRPLVFTGGSWQWTSAQTLSATAAPALVNDHMSSDKTVGSDVGGYGLRVVGAAAVASGLDTVSGGLAGMVTPSKGPGTRRMVNAGGAGAAAGVVAGAAPSPVFRGT